MRWIMSALLLCLLAHGAAAQPAMGDVVVISHTGDFVAYINRTSGTTTTLATLPADPIPALMAANNQDILVASRVVPGDIWGVDPLGVVTTVAQSSGTGQGATVGMDWLQDGSVITAHSQFGVQGWLRSVSLQNNTFTTLFNPQISHVRHVAIDGDTGNALVPRWASGGDLLSIDLGSNMITTVVSGINSGACVDASPATGNYVVAEETFSGNLKVVSPSGTVVTTISVGSCRAVKVDDTTGNLVVATGTSGTNAASVLEFDANGNAINTWGPFFPDAFSGIEIYGSRTVHGQGPATPGSNYTVSFSFPGFGGAQYVAALSLSQRPGILLPGGTINLALDNIFLASLQGLFVTGFQGNLNANGQASGAINLPAFVPVGFRLYCSAVAVSGGNFITGNTIGITVQ